MSGPRRESVVAFDGTELVVHRRGPGDGGGRPVLLLHGLFSNAAMNWVRFSHAATLAEAGFEAIMPDLRAHGDSGKPHEPAAYPLGVLVRDVEAVVEALGLEQFDLVGFSLGARTAAAAAVAGLSPRRLVLAGMGLEGLGGRERRVGFFIDAIDRFDEIKQGDPAFMTMQFIKTMKIDRVAARLLLGTLEDLAPADLAALTMPTLVLCGEEDRDNGSPQSLVDALPNARLAEIPGTHMGSVTGPELGEAIARFLTA